MVGSTIARSFLCRRYNSSQVWTQNSRLAPSGSVPTCQSCCFPQAHACLRKLSSPVAFHAATTPVYQVARCQLRSSGFITGCANCQLLTRRMMAWISRRGGRLSGRPPMALPVNFTGEPSIAAPTVPRTTPEILLMF